jgi:hypothetical protein
MLPAWPTRSAFAVVSLATGAYLALASGCAGQSF